MRKQWSFRALAVLLVLSLLVTLSEEGILTLGNSTVSVYASGETAGSMTDSYITYNGTLDLSTVGGDPAAQDDPATQENPATQDDPAGQEDPSSQALSEEEAAQEAAAEAEAAKKLYSDGMIHIFNFRQLQLVGSLAALTTGDNDEETVGVGALITDENGEAVLYEPDAHYFIEGDIALPQNAVWKLPEYFTGKFSSEYTPAEKNDEAGENDGETADVEDDPDAEKNAEADRKAARLYDAATDTIYIQNIYQLKTLADSRRAETPVMSEDWNAAAFGSGQFIYPGAESEGYLTYSSSHHYVISEMFTAEKPETAPIALRGGATLRPYASANVDHVDGRDYFGQVSVTIGGVEYILIGDRQQLEAINYGDDKVEVYGPVYKVVQKRDTVTGIGGSNEWYIDSVELVYPGDADLIQFTMDGQSKDFSGNPLYSDPDELNNINDAYEKLGSDTSLDLKTKTIYCGIDPQTGDYNIDQTSNPYDGLKYTKDANYIVFRDIDMENVSWTPLMFQGSMYGVKSTGGGKLWDDGKTQMNIDTGNKPNITHINVVPAEKNGKLDVLTHMGVGFFATLSSDLDRTNMLSTTSVIQNLKLSNGTVNNPYTEGYVDQTVVNGLLTGLGTVLGVVLDLVLSSLLGGKDVNLREVLTSLLNARKDDPSGLATGAFVGRIVGDVAVLDCEVENIRVSTVQTTFEENDKIVGKGGFVGYVQGKFQYDGLSNALQGVVDALSTVLNVIPGVGLGDLVDVLLGNTLPVGNLIPTGYTNPTIERNTVTNGTLSNEAGKIGVGGFAGTICGSNVKECRVTDSTMTIRADVFGGGFAGVVRDDIVKATLGDLGVIMGSLYPQSEVLACSIENSNLTFTGGGCNGGFLGVQANSYAIDCTIDSASRLTFKTDGDCIGGFTGKAQLGSSFGLASYLLMDASLLSTVKGVLTGALSQDNAQELLALGGVAQSGILGAKIDARLDMTTAGDKIGGIVGSGEAVYVAKSTVANVRELSKYSDDDVQTPPVTGRGNTVTKLVKVNAMPKRGTGEQSFAGGVAGHLISANTGSLLGDTLGLKSYLGFHLSDVDAYGVDGGYSVEACKNYAGGAIGFAIGGDVEKVFLHELEYVVADNHAGGFVGTTGPDKVVGGNGLDLNLLGLSVLKINNLLGLTSGLHTDYFDCAVDGISSGFTVEAVGYRVDDDDRTNFTAGGFAGDTTSVTMTNCYVRNLLSVTADKFSGIAGGFVGQSSYGSLDGVSAESDEGATALDLGQLLQLEADLIPSYYNCEVTFVDGGFVTADSAGGFTGDFRSGTVNVNPPAPDVHGNISLDTNAPDPDSDGYVVHNIDHVLGSTFAGGFGGKVYSGALLRDGGSGLSLLGGVADLDITGIADITEAYIPIIHHAGVDAPNGFSVMAAYVENEDMPSTAGFAGGFIGYGSGLEVSQSNVKSLRTGNVSVPANLEEKEGTAYMQFDPAYNTIPYAVAGSRYAGGYIGYVNVGSATALGDGLKLLGEDLQVSGVLDALDIVSSTIEHSDVYGMPGGFSVLASSHVNLGDGSYDEKGVGYAGGFAGKMLGAHIQNSNAENFAYVIGEVAAGGYAGEMLPGDVADVLDYEKADGGLKDLLKNIIETDDMVALVQAFVPTIYNSRSTCIPCGGAVRAQSFSDSSQDFLPVKRGYAGGYVGHASAAQIFGTSSAEWGDEENYNGPKRDCDIIRIRSVYGAEFAGGYVGLLEAGSTAKAGNLSLLGGLVDASNLLGALNVVYPTIERGNVYGPLAKTDLDTWNKWVRYIGSNGGFASELSKVGTLSSQEQLDEVINQFIYGYHTVAGRDEYDADTMRNLNGCAGGFAGAMYSGIIRYCTGNDAKLVKAMRGAGGFAGDMETKGLTEFGSADLLGGTLNLELGSLLDVASILVPVIFESGVTGYQNGLIVRAEGVPQIDEVTYQNGEATITKTVYTDNGIAGGFVGICYGGQMGSRIDGQINFEAQDPVDGVWVRNLKTVTGKNSIGGFAGKTSSASVANADSTEASDGFLQGLLDTVFSNPSQLVDALDATITVIGKAEVTAAKPEWGIVVDGEYTVEENGEQVTKFAPYAGGFVGSSEATVFGARDIEERTLTVSHLRGVSGGHYVGGFFGLAQVGSVAEVGDSNASTNVLDLLQAGNVSLLDIFRTYIYHASVSGVEDGITILAHDQTSSGTMSTYQVSGAAGGFGGGLMNGTVEHSSVSDLNFVLSPNYSGGFIGIIGTSGGIGVDKVKAETGEQQANLLSTLGLDLGLNPQLLNVVGSTVTECNVSGLAKGFITRTSNIQVPNDDVTQADLKGSCAAGFAGMADMAQIRDCHVTSFKIAQSPQVAGGFVGRSAMNYLVDVDVDSALTEVVVKIVNALVKALYLDQAQQINLIDLDSDLAGLKLMSDGDLLYVNLFGLKIAASLSKNDPEYNQDAVIVTIGSSTIKLPCDENGLTDGADASPDISITLIEGNRTNIEQSSVVGIDDGYDVFAGGATEAADGTDVLGYAGGFIGYNDAGAISESFTELCDVIRGTPNEENQPSLVGPFAGYSNPRSRGRAFLEDNGNHYHIYRVDDGGYTEVKTDDATTFGTAADEKVTINGESCNDYEVQHLAVIANHEDLKDAVESGSGSRALNAYVSPAMEVLMLNVPLDDNGMGDTPVTSDLKDPCDTEFDLTVNKVWKDFIYLASRPETITVTITQVEAGTTPPDAMITSGSTEGKTVVSTRTLTLDNSNGSTWSTSWQATVEDLPVAVRKTVGNTEQVVYYQYIVNETAFDNYTPYYEADQASASATITNRYTGPLIPDTGGEGVMMVYALGLFLLIGGTMMLVMVMTPERKRKLGAEDVELEESNFSDFLKKLGKKQ